MRQLRRVLIKHTKSQEKTGYFHRYVYISNNYESITKALIELDSGDLELFDLRSIKFLDKPDNYN
ncbi:hypothetical protein [Marivirga harenae]|uniref:hypothetical protein n=1 Tax=Marivirga harenae TaxID=2010992 RepID=UPI0026DFC5BF|nr:hypothetical protein [Marivirga harenae]WKV11462.1 hypothetical protein Q3Y49_14745 [Marivirga harenae]